ncbi:hypothetical protein B296_00035473 [Ensete ventricosum]|uniref:Uncharacterized protein n=1 Tax=Ensete ventricosum TaxID=4639 RepID=A0A426XF91_ENSVE|nr:hypothetical protein B296_00035473 [Ensete ventricosum]
MVLRSNIVLYFSINGSSVWTVVHRDLVILRGHQLNLDLLISRDVRWKRKGRKEGAADRRKEEGKRGGEKEEGKRGEEMGLLFSAFCRGGALVEKGKRRRKKKEAAARAVAKREEEGKRGEEEGKEREEEEERKEVAAVVAAPLFPAKETEEVQ